MEERTQLFLYSNDLDILLCSRPRYLFRQDERTQTYWYTGHPWLHCYRWSCYDSISYPASRKFPFCHFRMLWQFRNEFNGVSWFFIPDYKKIMNVSARGIIIIRCHVKRELLWMSSKKYMNSSIRSVLINLSTISSFAYINWFSLKLPT